MRWSLYFDAAVTSPSWMVTVASAVELDDHLAALIERGYGSALLVPSDGGHDAFLMGVEGRLAFVQYSRSDPAAYEVLFASTGRDTGDEAVEFNVGNTPTGMPLRLCIPTDQMRRITLHYAEHRRLPDWMTWDTQRWPDAQVAPAPQSCPTTDDIPF